MTLTELKYVVAVARHKHFGSAADACFVAQPTLSVAVKKLEEELGVTMFERGGTDIYPTPIGAQIVAQAEHILDQVAAIKEIAKQNQDPLSGAFRLGLIYTVGPYLLPTLIKGMIQEVPNMPLVLQENFTTRLLELLRQGELDAAIVALPLPEKGFMTLPLYDEPFVVAVPKHHSWANRPHIDATELKSETMLLLGHGHCFRDQVLEVCPEMAHYSTSDAGIARTFEGSSLETIRHMVASGIGITVLPKASAPNPTSSDDMLVHLPFSDPVPNRTIALVWRKSFTRSAAITAIQQVVLNCDLPGVSMLPQASIS